jgi:hypothetical protein
VNFQKSKQVSLKAHAAYNEKWLQERIVEDPTLLGLGDLEVKDVERRQPRAGRLDLLLSDPETLTRYEVEIQLGATDETHIIRTIEYWDIEKGRYPQYEHVAVIVAEDITSRFLNVISLFNRTIPLIAIQINALEVGGILTLHSTKVLDLVQIGTEEDDEPGQATDRDYWLKKGSPISMALVDGMIDLINEVVPGMALKYNRHYVGLSRHGMPDNFVAFRPRKGNVICELRIPRSDDTSALIDDSGLDTLPYNTRWGQYRVRVSPNEFAEQRTVIKELIRRANGGPASQDDGDDLVTQEVS